MVKVRRRFFSGFQRDAIEFFFQVPWCFGIFGGEECCRDGEVTMVNGKVLDRRPKDLGFLGITDGPSVPKGVTQKLDEDSGFTIDRVASRSSVRRDPNASR